MRRHATRPLPGRCTANSVSVIQLSPTFSQLLPFVPPPIAASAAVYHLESVRVLACSYIRADAATEDSSTNDRVSSTSTGLGATVLRPATTRSRSAELGRRPRVVAQTEAPEGRRYDEQRHRHPQRGQQRTQRQPTGQRLGRHGRGEGDRHDEGENGAQPSGIEANGITSCLEQTGEDHHDVLGPDHPERQRRQDQIHTVDDGSSGDQRDGKGQQLAPVRRVRRAACTPATSRPIPNSRSVTRQMRTSRKLTKNWADAGFVSR